MFRRAKLMLGDIDGTLIAAADQDGRSLVATIELTDSSGGPRCGRARPPAIEYSISA